MVDQTDGGMQQRLQGATPLLVSVAAGAAAGAIAVVARKAMSGGGGDAGSATGRRQEGTTQFDDLEQVAKDLEGLVDQLRSESGRDRDFRRLVTIADTISEYADQAANAFAAAASDPEAEREEDERRVTDDLMGRIGELTGATPEKAGSGSGRAGGEASKDS